MAQTRTDYDEKWKNVEDLINKQGLVKTAIGEVGKIYDLAVKEKQEAQQIKALIYLAALEENLDEEGETKGILKLESELAHAKAPATQILHSILASRYYHYFQENRWRLYGRTPVLDKPGNGLENLSIEELHNKIGYHYEQSLTDEAVLKKISLEAYEPLINKGNARALRPTLFDMLAFEALAYFTNDERDLKKPSYSFSINSAEAFSPAERFVRTTFQTSDTASLYHHALLIYQELLAFHLKDQEPSALLDADLDRLDFMHRVSISENKDQLYNQALLDLQQRYPGHPYGALAGAIRLENLYQEAMEYQPGVSDPQKRTALVAIRKELEILAAQNPGTAAGTKARDVLRSITQESISVKTELVNIPRKPFLSLVSYRNLDTFYYRIIRVDDIDELKRTTRYDEYWEKLVRLTAVKQVLQVVPKSEDHREHKVEIKIDALPEGSYALLSSTSADFSLNANELSVQYFHVSQIAYMKRGSSYFILNRETGEPLKGASVRVMQQSYDGSKSRMVFNAVLAANTNADGYLKIDLPKNINSYALDISWKKDRLFTKRTEYYSAYIPETDQPRENIISSVFTDRSIYRPGQTVYFKGILIQKIGNKSTVSAGIKTTVTLFDANGQKKDSASLITNEFGSYHGSFRIPENLMTGNFQIRDNAGRGMAYFSVEEYKRPTFEVVLDKLNGSYRVNDTVEVTGTVAGYAGNNLNDAAVKYRVVRKANFPWWRMNWWPESEEMEITHGETTSDANGKFSVRFKAIPDPTIRKSLDPSFSYQLLVDATDNSGESRSSHKTMTLGYQALQLRLAMDDEYQQDSLKTITVTAENAEASPQKLPVELKVTSLQAPLRLLKKRYWELPDTSLMSKEEFMRSFPNDPYMNEEDPSGWARLKTVVNRKDSTGKIKIDNTVLAPGYYVVEVLGKDRYGEEVKDLKYIRILGKEPASPSYTWTKDKRIIAEAGMSVNTMIGSSADKVFAIIQTDRMGKDDDYSYQVIRLKNKWQTLTTPLTEADRGGVTITEAFIKHNRFFQVTNEIEVPWANKKLDISVETYRDKLLPGSKETWKLNIRGYNGEKLAAEMLTTMYDASLDQFRPHTWQFPSLYDTHMGKPWEAASNFTTGNEETRYLPREQGVYENKQYDSFIWNSMIGRDRIRMTMSAAPMQEQVVVTVRGKASVMDTTADGLQGKVAGVAISTPEPEGPITPRTNFNETAFFFPDLKTDENGDISFSFTTPESLTRWKWMMLAHTKEMASGLETKNIITQKDLMIQSNMPRFLREGDKIRLSARVSNLTDKEITGQAFLQLIDPATEKPVDGWFQNIFPSQYFTVEARQTGAVFFEIQVPANYNRPLQYRVLARAGQQTDGEENMIAVLSNRLLVTESLPLIVKGNGTKSYQFKELSASAGSNSIAHQNVTVEYSTNPAWYAVLALPYLMEYPYECSEQNFNRFYANALASLTANSSPAIRAMFEKWKNSDTAALISNLMKNPELKNILLEQTPWVMQAASETEQRRNIGLLFNLTRLAGELAANISKLKEMQLENGGFPWFKGGRDDRYMTQYILTGIGKLKKLQAVPQESQSTVNEMAKAALGYADRKIGEDYEELTRSKLDPGKNNLTHTQIQYLYLRSFYSDSIPSSYKKAYEYYLAQARQNWVGRDLISQAMIAIIMERAGNKEQAKAILRSLKENSITTEELGMYWKKNSRGYYWYQSPIETQAQVIEAFSEIGNDLSSVENMKLWLLNQKRVQGWPTTKATADAVYVLLKTGGSMLNNDPQVVIQLGDKRVESANENKEAGTGYFKTVIPAASVSAKMGTIKVEVNGNNNTGISWGAVHWQYFEDMDKVKSAATPVQLSRVFFVERNTDKGPALTEIKPGDEVHVGDKIKVRIQLKADRDMEYMHLKDLRASGTEPVNVLSEYKWQGGLGYYESTRDASTDFFFSWLPKGTWVFEYPLFVTHAGDFAAGISTIQSMYAPEFNAHSEGTRVAIAAAVHE